MSEINRDGAGQRVPLAPTEAELPGLPRFSGVPREEFRESGRALPRFADFGKELSARVESEAVLSKYSGMGKPRPKYAQAGRPRAEVLPEEPLADAVEVDKLDVRKLQQLLAEARFSPGPIDGIRGSKTDGAIARAAEAYTKETGKIAITIATDGSGSTQISWKFLDWLDQKGYERFKSTSSRG